MTAERFARFFGTPRFIIGQTVLVVIWIALNAPHSASGGTPTHSSSSTSHPQTQAAYAAPLILPAQTRQAERDRLRDAATQEHHDADIERERAFEDRQTEVLRR